jgi:hypothetical protein
MELLAQLTDPNFINSGDSEYKCSRSKSRDLSNDPPPQKNSDIIKNDFHYTYFISGEHFLKLKYIGGIVNKK